MVFALTCWLDDKVRMQQTTEMYARVGRVFSALHDPSYLVGGSKVGGPCSGNLKTDGVRSSSTRSPWIPRPSNVRYRQRALHVE